MKSGKAASSLGRPTPSGAFLMPWKEAQAMPRKPKRPCRYPGCPNLCEDGEQYCDGHKALMERLYFVKSVFRV